MDHILITHSSTGGHLDYFHFLIIMNYGRCFEDLCISFCVDILLLSDMKFTSHLRVQFLDFTVTLHVTFRGTAELFARVVTPFYTPTSSV